MPQNNYFQRRPIFQRGPRTNNQIKALQVRVIDEKGQNMGEISTEEAIRVAKERGLDLLEVSPDSVPPVCRIVDIGKWKYEQAKKERIQRAHQKQVETKGIRISIRASLHDLGIRARQSEKFLNQGDKVRIEMILRGRERANEAFARERFGEFTSLLAVPYRIEQDIKREPKGLSMIIAKGKSNNSLNNDLAR